MAFAKIFNQPVDLEYRKGGDKFDNKIGKRTFDIKCAMSGNSGRNLIQYINERGQINQHALSKDYYILSYIESDDRMQKKCKIVIVGYVTKKDIQECETQIAEAGHSNYVVRFSKSRSIVKMLEIKKQKCGN